MFVDYSGLQRFSTINENFANKYLQMLHFDAIQPPEQRFGLLKEHSEDFKSIHLVRLEDFRLDWGIIDYLYKMLLCITQMREVASYIKRCPTVYVVEMFDRTCPMSRYSMENLSGTLAKACQEFQCSYNDIRNELCEEVKRTIVELKPDYGFLNFEKWHPLQKFLFHECLDNLPKYMIPQTQVILIPKVFPRLYMEQVNGNGFMKASSQMRFLIFDTLSAERGFDSVGAHELVLKLLDSKVTTIWKENEENDFIGTATKNTLSEDVIEEAPSLEYTSKEPDFLRVFQERDANADANQVQDKVPAKLPALHKRTKMREYCKYSNSESESTNDEINTVGVKNSDKEKNSDEERSQIDIGSSSESNHDDIFSPLSFGNLQSAVTPDNCSEKSEKEKKCLNLEDMDYAASLFPPPPELPPNAFRERYNYNEHQSKRESVKLKFREYIGRPIQKCFIRTHEPMLFDTADSFAEFQGALWDDMSSKKFIKFKLKKFKRDCRYYGHIAKSFFEDLHEDDVRY